MHYWLFFFWNPISVLLGHCIVKFKSSSIKLLCITDGYHFQPKAKKKKKKSPIFSMVLTLQELFILNPTTVSSIFPEEKVNACVID